MSTNLAVVIPVYNDWNAVELLVPKVIGAVKNCGASLQIFLVDDGSNESAPRNSFAMMSGGDIKILKLRRNLGHQRAISIALAYLYSKVQPDYVAIMDGDGEDDPNDLPRLLNKIMGISGPKAVFAARARRVETFFFRVFYSIYKLLYFMLTGHGIKFGNFSVINSEALSSLVVAPETWSHYAAAVVKLRIPVDTIPTFRLKRIQGKSKMNFFSLVVHGLGAMSVFGDIIGARVIGVVSAAIALVLICILSAISIKIWTVLAIPGWATYTIGLLVATLLQLGTLAVVFAFLTLASRQNSSFLPIRDYAYYVETAYEISKS